MPSPSTDERDIFKLLYFAGEGDARAQWQLGNCYADGRGVPKDDREAVKWYRLAAKQGEAEAQFYLGNCYVHGWGVPKDDRRAKKWFRRAAAQGHTEASQMLQNSITAIRIWVTLLLALLAGIAGAWFSDTPIGVVLCFIAVGVIVYAFLKF